MILAAAATGTMAGSIRARGRFRHRELRHLRDMLTHRRSVTRRNAGCLGSESRIPCAGSSTEGRPANEDAGEQAEHEPAEHPLRLFAPADLSSDGCARLGPSQGTRQTPEPASHPPDLRISSGRAANPRTCEPASPGSRCAPSACRSPRSRARVHRADASAGSSRWPRPHTPSSDCGCDSPRR